MNQVFGWFIKHFHMLLAVCISISSIGLDVPVQAHWNTFWFFLCVMFGDKISSDKGKRDVIKMS